MLGLLGLFVAAQGAGGDACEGPSNDDAIGDCTLHEAIGMVNPGHDCR